MRFKFKITVAAVLVLAGLASWYLWAAPFAREADSRLESPDRLYTLRKGNMIIGIRQVGFVNSQKSYKLSLEAAVNTKLLWVVAENASVKKGEILAKFETDALVEKIDNLKIDIENLTKEIEVEQQAMRILESTNRASIRQAEDKVVAAEDAYRKYRNFERRQRRDSLELDLQKKEKAYEEALNNFTKQRNDFNAKGATNEDEARKHESTLNALQQKVDSAENDKRNAEQEIKVFKRYSNPSKLNDLTNQMEQSKLDLEKIKISTASQVLQKERTLSNLRMRLRSRREQLAKDEENLSLMQITSPVDGVVIYGDPDRRWGNLDVRTGMDIRRGQVLMTIPDMSRLAVEFDLPEQYRSKVRIGDKVVITPESIRQLRIEGHLDHIDQLPVNQIHWDRNSPKIYKSRINIQHIDPRLVNGMSVQLEVITKEIEDTLFVPVESIFEEAGDYFVYRQTGNVPRRQPIRIGESNDNYVRIIDGLEEGDTVYLYQPFAADKK